MNYAPDIFGEYVTSHADQVHEVEDLLAEILPDDPVNLTIQLRTIEAFYGRLVAILADANAFLDVAEDAVLPHKGSGTELDRKTAQRAAVADQRAYRDKLDGLGRAINIRLMLGMSLLKQHESERRGLGASVGQA